MSILDSILDRFGERKAAKEAAEQLSRDQTAAWNAYWATLAALTTRPEMAAFGLAAATGEQPPSILGDLENAGVLRRQMEQARDEASKFVAGEQLFNLEQHALDLLVNRVVDDDGMVDQREYGQVFACSASGEPSKLPGKPQLVARSVLGGFRPGLAFAGAMPRGTVSGESLEKRIDEMYGDDSAWPKLPTWLVTVRLKDGKRLVLGRDDVQVASIGQGVRASTAVPGTFAPVTIDGNEYVDGAVHSTTNVDLLAGLGLDGVVVSSPKSIAANSANWKEYTSRTFFRRAVQAEVDKVQKSGIPVLLVEPDIETIDILETEPLDTGAVAAAAGRLTKEALGRSKKVAKRLAEQAGKDSQ